MLCNGAHWWHNMGTLTLNSINRNVVGKYHLQISSNVLYIEIYLFSSSYKIHILYSYIIFIKICRVFCQAIMLLLWNGCSWRHSKPLTLSSMKLCWLRNFNIEIWCTWKVFVLMERNYFLYTSMLTITIWTRFYYVSSTQSNFLF